MAPVTKQTAKPNAKPVFKTSSPFSETRWPEVSREDEEVILELLCNLIAPLGDHRKTYIHPSKGKKRKRSTKPNEDGPDMLKTTPPLPEIGNHLLVGINSVTRHLEALVAKTAPSTAPVTNPRSTSSGMEEKHRTTDHPEEVLRPLSMVILTHPKPSVSPAHAHLPTLVHLSALPSPSATSETGTRLVSVQTSSEARLASSLHIPRVGALAIYEGALGAKVLEEYVREHIGPTESKWIDEAMSAEWKGLNVKSEIPGSK